MPKESEKRLWKVYVHTNKINQKRYVGITKSKNPERRWRNGTGYKGSSRFYNAIQKYGWDGFDHRVIYDNLTEQEAKDMEVLLIEILRTRADKYGYNITKGGDDHGNNPTNRIPVYQFTTDGDFIQEFPSMTSAAKSVGGLTSAILTACEDEKKFSSYGYCWRRKVDCEDLTKIKEEILIRKEKKGKWTEEAKSTFGKRVCQLDQEGNLLNTFNNAVSAASVIGCDSENISSACRNEGFAREYRWMLEEDYQKILSGEKSFNFKRPKIVPVLQFDLNGNFLHEYPSTTAAEKATGIKRACISNACKTHGISYGYFWRSKDDYVEGEQFVDPREKIRKSVCQFTLDGKFVAKYKSTMEASEKTGCSVSNIGEACNNNQRTALGFFWKFASDCVLQEDGSYKMKEIPTLYDPRAKSKSVYQFDENLNFVKEYSGAFYASVELDINMEHIRRACWSMGSSHGFLWRYEDGITIADDGTIAPIVKTKEYRHVIQLTIDFEFVKEYPSTKDASLATGIDNLAIRYACYDKYQSNGYRWIWADEYEDYMRSKGYEVTAISA